MSYLKVDDPRLRRPLPKVYGIYYWAPHKTQPLIKALHPNKSFALIKGSQYPETCFPDSLALSFYCLLLSRDTRSVRAARTQLLRC